MVLVFSALSQILILIALGWGLGRRNILTTVDSAGLNKFVTIVSQPAICFYAIYQEPIKTLLNGRFISSLLIMYLSLLFCTYIIYRLIFKIPQARSVLASICVAISNSGFVGLPVLLISIGRQGILPVAMTIIVVMLILLPISILMLEADRRDEGQSTLSVITKTLVKSIRHPLIFASLLALVFAIFQIKLPTFLDSIVQFLESTLVPCALISIGLELARFHFSLIKEVLIVSIAATIIRPILACIIAWLLHLSPFYAVSLIIIFAAPSSKTSFVLASAYKTYVKEASAILSLTTVLSFITIPIALIVTYHLWPTIFIRHL